MKIEGSTTLDCGCVVTFRTVPNDLPDRNGNVFPFTLEAEFSRMCPEHQQTALRATSIGRTDKQG